MKKSKKDPKWKLAEKFVAMLEQHLDHDAKVEHDVMLPDLNDPDQERQCDIVVTQGKKPRETISIVEVQSRNEKPSIADFDSWCVKMEAVGAQHLICVSEKGFPESVQKKAARKGPSVRLVTLIDGEDIVDQWLDGVGGLQSVLQNVTYHKMLGIDIIPIGLIRANPNKEATKVVNPHLEMFVDDKGTSVTPSMIFDMRLFGSPADLAKLPVGEDIVLGQPTEFPVGKLWYKNFDGTKVPVKSIQINMSLRIDNYPIEWIATKYEQLEDELGWILSGKSKLPSGEVELVIPFRSTDVAGQYMMGRPLSVSDHDIFVQSGNRGFPGGRLDQQNFIKKSS